MCKWLGIHGNIFSSIFPNRVFSGRFLSVKLYLKNDSFGLIQGIKAEWSLNKQTINEKDFDGIRSEEEEEEERIKRWLSFLPKLHYS